MLKIKLTDADFYPCKREYLSEISRYASRGILMNEHHQIALLHMRKNGFYKLPGGGLEGTEKREEAFLREIKEETGYHCAITEYIGHTEEHKLQTHFFQYSYCYLARVIGGSCQCNLTANEKRLGMELVWMSWEEALDQLKLSCEVCQNYKMNFMLLRDFFILDYAYKTYIVN